VLVPSCSRARHRSNQCMAALAAPVYGVADPEPAGPVPSPPHNHTWPPGRLRLVLGHFGWRRSWEAIIEASVGKPRIWQGGTEKRNVLRYAKAIPQADDHPTPKPVPLLEEIIRAAAPSRGLILDPFAGSGPTLIAAERTGRSCCAAELEPRYCDIVVARWEALTGSKSTCSRG